VIRLVAASVLILSLGACASDPIPPIGSGLPNNVHDAQMVFDTRVKSLFPAGSDPETLRAELLKQGFQFSNTQNLATLEAHEFPCLDSWRISWSTDTGKIVSVRGDFRETCP